MACRVLAKTDGFRLFRGGGGLDEMQGVGHQHGVQAWLRRSDFCALGSPVALLYRPKRTLSRWHCGEVKDFFPYGAYGGTCS